MAEKIAKDYIKRGKMNNKKALLDVVANTKKSLSSQMVAEVFEADTNKDGYIDMEEWKQAVTARNSSIISLINPAMSVHCIKETVVRADNEL